jgi:hypothetical protein
LSYLLVGLAMRYLRIATSLDRPALTKGELPH